MFSGSVLSWFVLMPLISLFAGDAIIFPGTKPISSLAPSELWGTYIKYIGAGAVATGGIISLIKSLPLIVKTFSQAMKSMSNNKGKAASGLRTDQDMPMPVILIGVGVIAIAIWLLPTFPINLLGAVIVVIFGFFFATVSSRMVGLIGSSNNPVSGMAIATLLIATILLKATGLDGATGMKGAIAIGSIICIVAAIAGDTSQDLKTGFIVGATPKKTAVGRIDRCSYIFTCNRWSTLPAQRSMGIWFNRTSGSAGYNDENDRGRCYECRSSLGIDRSRCSNRNCS